MGEERNEIKKSLDEVKSFDVTKLGRREELGKEFNFEEAEGLAQNLIQLFSLIPTEIIDQIPETQANQVKKFAEQALNSFKQIVIFSAKQENAAQVHIQLTKEVRNQYQLAFNGLHPVLSFITAQNPNLKKLRDEASKATKIVEDLGEKNSTVESILENVRQTAAEKGLAQEATHFKDEAETHSRAAVVWLTLTGLIALILALFVINQINADLSSWANIAKKLSVLFVLATILIFFARNYAVSKQRWFGKSEQLR